MFLKRAAKVISYPIEIIAGQEEARLIFMGVAHTQLEKGRKLVIDIGGGSTELVIGEDFEPLLAESCRMGCVIFAQIFSPAGRSAKKLLPRTSGGSAEARVPILAVPHSWLAACAWHFGYHQGRSRSVGSDGQERLPDHPRAAEDARRAGAALPYKNFSSLRSLAGLSEERQPVFVAGLAILYGVFDALAIGELRLSGGALCEGVLYEMEGRFRYQDIRSRTAKSLADHYKIDREQAKRVLETSELLYSQWMVQNTKLVQPQLEALLKWSTILHEVGLSINQNGM